MTVDADETLTHPAGTLAMLETSTAQLLRELEHLTDEQILEPSLLPGWTRGHTLTHLARNADALINLLTWAQTGVETPAYPSQEARNADIEEGAGRTAHELRDDIWQAHQRFVAAAAELTETEWDAIVSMGMTLTARYVPFLRLTEVEVHHADLGMGHTPAHWPAPFVTQLLVHTAAELPERTHDAFHLVATDTGWRHTVHEASGPVVSGPQTALLAWILGRSNGDGLTVEPARALPELGAWR